MKMLSFLFSLFFLFSCDVPIKPGKSGNDNSHLRQEDQHVLDSLKTLQLAKEKSLKQEQDSLMLQNNLVDVQTLNPLIYVDLKYASIDNFMKIKLYERLNRAYLQKDVADRLVKAQIELTAIDTSLHLLIYDAVRPISTQWKMWRALDTMPSHERGKYVSNPVNKSLHNFGAAIDLTICDSNGKPLDMGAEFDDFRTIAYPSMEAHFLANGELSKEQVENRKLLRKVMRSQGFRNLQTEWWHFNACSRADALMKYKVLEKEI